MFESLGLRAYQESDVQRIADAFHRVRRVLYTLATGAGKTHVAVAHIIAARRRDVRVLFVAHRRELVNQAAKRLVDNGVPRETIGVIMATDMRACSSAPVQVASLETLRRRDRPDADMVFVDECHRALAPTYRKLLALYPDARVLGLTATPYRLDGRGLHGEFDEMVIGASPEELIALGWLAKCRTFTVPDDLLPALTDVKVARGDYVLEQLGRVMNRRPLVAGIVQEYRRLGEDRAAVVFCSGLEHARVTQAEFAAAGFVAEYLDGDTPIPDRDAMLDRMRAGRTKILVNCDVLVEGWDAPWVKCAILARPTKSLGRYLQMVGRIMRPWNGVAPLVLDHAGNAIMHGPPEIDRSGDLTLEDRGRKGNGNAKVFGKRCPQCGITVAAGTRMCQECGFEWTVEEVPDVVEGELIEAGKLYDSSKVRGTTYVGGTAKASKIANEWRAKKQAKERREAIRDAIRLEKERLRSDVTQGVAQWYLGRRRKLLELYKELAVFEKEHGLHQSDIPRILEIMGEAKRVRIQKARLLDPYDVAIDLIIARRNSAGT